MTVWCALGKVAVIGPYFFDENWITTNVNSARYIDKMNNFLEPELRSRGINNQNVWFQQDGTTAQTARATMTVVRAMFPDRLISRCGDVLWPPRHLNFQCAIFFCRATSGHVHTKESHEH